MKVTLLVFLTLITAAVGTAACVRPLTGMFAPRAWTVMPRVIAQQQKLALIAPALRQDLLPILSPLHADDTQIDRCVALDNRFHLQEASE